MIIVASGYNYILTAYTVPIKYLLEALSIPIKIFYNRLQLIGLSISSSKAPRSYTRYPRNHSGTITIAIQVLSPTY